MYKKVKNIFLVYYGSFNTRSGSNVHILELLDNFKKYAGGELPTPRRADGIDISDQYDSMRCTKWVASVSILGAIVTLSLLLIGLLQRMVFQRLAAITKIATRLVGGDYETPLIIGSNDEIGAFENLFEQRNFFAPKLIREKYSCV